jgi:hypothetical protein
MGREPLVDVAVLAVASVVATLTACGGEPPSDGATTSGAQTAGDDVVQAASSETMSELGIERWGLKLDEGVRVRGYDHEGGVVATFRERLTIVDGANRTFEASVDGGFGSAVLRLTLAATAGDNDAEAVVTTTVVENSLSASPAAKRVLERAQADASNAVEQATGAAGMLKPQGVTVPGRNPLVVRCEDLLSCQTKLVAARDAAFRSTDACAELRDRDQERNLCATGLTGKEDVFDLFDAPENGENICQHIDSLRSQCVDAVESAMGKVKALDTCAGATAPEGATACK